MRHSVPRSSTPTARVQCRSGFAGVPQRAVRRRGPRVPRRGARVGRGGGARFGWCWEVSGEVEKNLVENMGRTLIGVLDHS